MHKLLILLIYIVYESLLSLLSHFVILKSIYVSILKESYVTCKNIYDMKSLTV